MMRLLWLLISLACFTTYAVYLTTTPIKQKAAQLTPLLRNVGSCIFRDNYLSPRDIYFTTFICISRDISHCLWNTRNRYDVDQLSLPNITMYCGIVASARSTWEALFKQIDIFVAPYNVIHIQFLTFNFEWVQYDCEEHGITVIDIGNKNSFCGERLPWILLTTGHTAQLKIRTLWDKNYKFRISYSHYNPHWAMATYKIYSRIGEMEKLNLMGMTDDTVGYDFYLQVEPHAKMQIDMIYQYSENINIIFHDGPGVKSNILFKISDSQHSNKTSTLTTAHLAMIRFIRLTKFTIKINQFWDADIMCKMHYTDNKISIRSTPLQPMRCCLYSNNASPDSMDVKYRFAVLNIHKFSFNGPLTLDGDKHFNCQYGGLFIMQHIGNTNQYICQNRQNYKIYSDKTNILFFLVWYPEYSNYMLEAYLMASSCLGQYTTFEKNLTSSIDHPFIVNDLFPCQLIICTPAITKEKSAFCTISISGSVGPVGTTEVLVERASSLRQCFDFETYSAKFNLKASYTGNWPFGKPRTMLISRKSFEKFNYFFHYLNNMTAVFPYVCSEKDYTKQLSIRIEIAMCKVTSGVVLFNPINHVHSLTAECSDIRMSFKFYFENSTSFTKIYDELNVFCKEGERKHVGKYISVIYGDCPEECRNFTYTLLIWDKDKQLIYKYTSSVGTDIFTGYFFHGLKLSITRPLPTCGRHTFCEMLYSSLKPHDSVGNDPTKRMVDRQTRKMYFNQKRYVIYR